MKRKLSLLAVCLLAAAASASAQTITEADGKYTIAVGQTTMTIDATRGGKILSYKLGDAEVLNQGRMPNSFGSTFWTSPQSEWNWPPVAEYDSKPFQAEIVGDKLVLTGDKSRFGYSVRKEFTAVPKKDAISITYTIVNESGETRQVAPWEISRVPNDGVLFFVAPAVEPANNMVGLPFEFTQGAAWYVMDEARENRKINADGRGWLAYCAKGLLFVKKFQDLKAGQAVDRVGLMLGLKFPCGPALEKLAMQSSSKAHMQVKLKNGCCSLSGLQNQCEKMVRDNVPAQDIARYCLNSVAAVLTAMTKAAAEKGTAVLYAGGVLSDRLIQDELRKLPLRTAFAEPAFSSDNAAGIAVYAARRAMQCQY